MTDKVIENNQVTVMGEVISRFTYSHEVFGEGFYMIDVRVPRLSDSYDTIPVMISERLLDVTENYTGMLICVNGQFRSYNRHEERKNRLVLSVFAREVEFVGRRAPRQIRFIWTVISVRNRFIEKHLWDGK